MRAHRSPSLGPLDASRKGLHTAGPLPLILKAHLLGDVLSLGSAASRPVAVRVTAAPAVGRVLTGAAPVRWFCSSRGASSRWCGPWAACRPRRKTCRPGRLVTAAAGGVGFCLAARGAPSRWRRRP